MSFKLMFLVTMVLVSLTMSAVVKKTETENDGVQFFGSGSGSGGILKVVCIASLASDSIVQEKILSAQAVHEPGCSLANLKCPLSEVPL